MRERLQRQRRSPETALVVVVRVYYATAGGAQSLTADERTGTEARPSSSVLPDAALRRGWFCLPWFMCLGDSLAGAVF